MQFCATIPKSVNISPGRDFHIVKLTHDPKPGRHVYVDPDEDTIFYGPLASDVSVSGAVLTLRRLDPPLSIRVGRLPVRPLSQPDPVAIPA